MPGNIDQLTGTAHDAETLRDWLSEQGPEVRDPIARKQ